MTPPRSALPAAPRDASNAVGARRALLLVLALASLVLGVTGCESSGGG